MPKISSFFGIDIEIRAREHGVPHFHASYQDGEIVIGIRPLAILAGSIKQRALGMVLEWASKHQDELLAAWNAQQTGKPANKIAPLE